MKLKKLLYVFDIAVIYISLHLSLWLRFDGKVPGIYATFNPYIILIVVIFSILVFKYFKLYSSLWTFASVSELKNIILACCSSALINIVVMTFTHTNLPRSWYIIYFLLLLLIISGSRIGYRIIRLIVVERGNYIFDYKNSDCKKVLIVGAGVAGNKIANEIKNVDSLRKKVVCFIDDDISKHKMHMNGIIVYGDRFSLNDAVKKFDVDEIFIAIPSLKNNIKHEIIVLCKETGCKVKSLPGIFQLVDDNISIDKLKTVEVEDLLGRDPIKVNVQEILGYVNNKVVMVTGGGGSIGSELCRQIAEKGPKKLIIVDIYENSAYEIQLELRKRFVNLNLEVMIASVRDAKKVNTLFKNFKPDIVYHAAAHKHVPLMEDSPNEAVKNNVFGTLNVVKAANRFEVKKFVLISTDKAVNPTNIMGATKRICEMIVQCYNELSKTDYVAVRFGNVLGSNGSVIPLFQKQIASGGPVTVTHPEITRYFMTIPEAVSLVLQAGSYANGGEIFVLDMGDPVKIVDLAKNLIKFSGYEPGVDIKIEFSGLRPGEKLYEELLMDEEGLETTANEMIKIGKPIKINAEFLFSHLDKLYVSAYRESPIMKDLVNELVDTYVIDNKK